MEKGKQTADTVRFSESSGSIKMFFWSCNLSTYVLLTTSFINLLPIFSQINTQFSLCYQGNCETVVKLISFGPGIIKGIENRLTGKKITGRYLPLHPCKMGLNSKKCVLDNHFLVYTQWFSKNSKRKKVKSNWVHEIFGS